MPIGIVEELFIATDPTTGLKEVWYRNSNVTRSLVIRSLLSANPESVNWGTWKNQFVVRTGTTLPTQQYAVFNLVRVGLSSGADGIGPTAVAHLVRIETPAAPVLDNIYLLQLQASYDSGTAEGRRWQLHGVSTFLGGVSSASFIGSPVTPTARTLATGNVNLTLKTLLLNVSPSGGLTFSGTSVLYGLDAYGDLIFTIVTTIGSFTFTGTQTKLTYVTGPGPSLCGWAGSTTTASAGAVITLDQAHLFVVNTTRALIVFQTSRPSPACQVVDYGGYYGTLLRQIE